MRAVRPPVGAQVRPQIVVLQAAYLYDAREGDSAHLDEGLVAQLDARVRRAETEGRITPAAARTERAALARARSALRRGESVAAVIRAPLRPDEQKKQVKRRRRNKTARASRRTNRPRKKAKR